MDDNGVDVYPMDLATWSAFEGASSFVWQPAGDIPSVRQRL